METITAMIMMTIGIILMAIPMSIWIHPHLVRKFKPIRDDYILKMATIGLVTGILFLITSAYIFALKIIF